MKDGCHFGIDLPNEACSYNNKSICHIVARQPCIIAYISKETRDRLYLSFPYLKTKMQLLNKLIISKLEETF